jgi:hypothetical protein
MELRVKGIVEETMPQVPMEGPEAAEVALVHLVQMLF